MHQLPNKLVRYALAGIAVLSLLIVLGWFALREEPSPPIPQLTPRKETAKPHVRQEVPAPMPAVDSTNQESTVQVPESVTQNAADLYRQAFDLFDALTNDEKSILSDWHTNVDASVEAEMCQKIRPICNLIYQASAMTNCNWGITLTDLELSSLLGKSRNLGRITVWNAAHCRSDDVAGATEDTCAILRLGQQVSQGPSIGWLQGIALQNIASSYVAQNVGLFGGADSQRLAEAFSDPAYEQAPSRMVGQGADAHESFAAKLAAMAPVEAAKVLSELATTYNVAVPDRDAAVTMIHQIVDSEREMARALASASEDYSEAWQEDATILQASNALAKGILEGDEVFVDQLRRAEIKRALVVAGLAVAQQGVSTLPSHPDPSSGKPFTYTGTADGFELQSSYEFNGEPIRMQFK